VSWTLVRVKKRDFLIRPTAHEFLAQEKEMREWEEEEGVRRESIEDGREA
jgi:hypothetical protein